MGVTAMARPTCAGGAKEIREDLRRKTRETGAFLERSGAEMKTAIFSERELLDKRQKRQLFRTRK